MCRPSRPEAERARQEVLLVDGLQHHDDRPLCHLVLEGRDAERSLRAIRFRDVDPAHRRSDIAAGLDALQEVQQLGLQVRLVIRRCHTVDAGRSILARQPIRLSHPFQVDDLVQRGQRCPRLRSRQFRYPLSFRGQVCGAQGLLPCFLATVLIPWRLPSLARVPVSPVPRGQQYDEGATTSRLRIPGHLFVSLPRSTRSSVVRARFGSAPGRVEDPIQARALVQPAAQVPACSRMDASGISQVPRRSIPCLCPGPRPRPDRRSLTMTVPSMLPPLNPQRRLQR
jgi:hypothetical protein